MSRLVWCSVLCATACNAVFGLEETAFIDDDAAVDMDMDGISDAVDNCPQVANDNQVDSDDDGRGDVCDGCDQCRACDRGADHDEDGDRWSDGCDNCPALANDDQANADGDELGDVCDESGGYERRLFFDGFGTLGDDWLEGGSRWLVKADDIGPAPEAMPGVTYTLQHATTMIPDGTRWVIELGLVPPGIDRAQLLFVGDSGFCMLDHRGDGSWRLTATATLGTPFSATFDATIRLRMTPNGQLGAQHVSCTIPNVSATADTINEVIYPVIPKIVTSDRDVLFRYIEVIGE